MARRLGAGDCVLADDPIAAASPARVSREPGRRKLVVVCGLCALVLFLAYYRLSWTAPVNFDGAADIFMAWDMLHGNVLLHGWWASDVSFYTTELPQWALIEAAFGPVPAAAHLAAALTYTLVVLLAAIVAKGRATGSEGVLRMVIAAGIMLAPQPGGGALVLDLSLGHIGTSIPLLIAWLLIDRAGARRWVPAMVGALLAWALVADPLVLYAGVVPLVTVCAARTYRAVVIQRRPSASAWFEIALTVAALAAIPAAWGMLTAIHSLGGFTVNPVHDMLATARGLPARLSVATEGILTLFGADFFGRRMGLNVGGAFLHVTGVVLAGYAVWLGLRRFARGTGPDWLAVEAMAVAVPVNLIAFVFSPFATSVYNAREIAIVLPFSAALAGRLLSVRLVSHRLLPALAVVLLGYVFTLAHGAAQRPAPADHQRIAAWLAAQHLRYGLSRNGEGSSVTLASSQRVCVRPVYPVRGKIHVDRWESKASWYDPKMHDANFMLLRPALYPGYAPYAQALATFGKPARTYGVGPYLVLVWNKNLLTDLSSG